VSGALEEYRRRRDFSATPEPAPHDLEAHVGAPRFVIQRHDARALHFDLRLELEGALRSWAVPKGIPLREGVKRLAVRTEDHPLDYLTFAGVIPVGAYGAGRMTIWDHGTFELVAEKDAEIKIVLHGSVVDGEYHLVRTGGADGREEWLVFRSAKGSPGPADPAAAFRALRPMIGSAWETAFDDPGWAFEIKWDGYRALALIGPDQTELRSRSGRDMTASYPLLADLRRATLAQEVILDGEIAALDDHGRAVFQDLQSGRGTVTFVAFDLLYVDGTWLMDRPWRERRERLEAVLSPEGPPRVITPDAVRGSGTALFGAIATRGGEGIVAKRILSTYQAGRRSPDWRKVKVRHEIDTVIGGYVEGEGSRRGGIGAILVGQQTDAGLTYVGRVGSGFTDAGSRALRGRLDRLTSDDCPFTSVPADRAGARWVRPEIQCRTAYGEWTDEGVMRSPVFLGLVEEEPDERPPSVLDLSHGELRVRDGEREAKLTNLAKPFWPAQGITKGDLLDHYARMAPVLVPHLRGRPMVLKRYPNGWDQPFFFQHKIPETAPPWLERVTLAKSDGDEPVTYVVIDDALSLLWVVNLGCIDLNPWQSRSQSVGDADYVVFDFDPSEGVPFDAVIDAALLLKEELDGVGLRGYPKTSGSRGIHVMVPVKPIPHESARLFAQLIGQQMVARRPQLVTVETAIARRGRRVYVDANQNGYGKTIASVYSVRPVHGATVSTPLVWDEVAAGFDPTRMTMGAVAARVSASGDLFAGMITDRQDLSAAVARLGQV
jgi:bifunctional non-homologous end joining protein LigD